jgi:hypothetical protein
MPNVKNEAYKGTPRDETLCKNLGAKPFKASECSERMLEYSPELAQEIDPAITRALKILPT